MRFDRKKFFDGFRDRLDSTIKQEQIDGLEFLLGRFETTDAWADVRHIAYALATIFHETAYSFQPVEEGYYLGSSARVKRFQKTLRYYPFFGRGYVQLTWKANYDKAGKALGLDLVNKPELALDPDVAFDVLTLGLFRGWFGGKLTTYINDKKTDYVNARRCVNILDKAGIIAGYARSFEKILRDSAADPAETSAIVTGQVSNPPAVDSAADAALASATNPQPNVDVKETIVTSEGEVEVSTKNEQNVTDTAQVTAPEPYLGVGFWGVIKRDLAAATGGNITFSSLAEYAQQASGWPEWIVGIISKIAVGLLIATVVYFIYRCIHYVVDTWKKNQKTKLEATINSDTGRKNIEWI